MEIPKRLPSYNELPVNPGYPPRSAWGLFGADDQIGTLNLLTPERVIAAAGLVSTGEVFALNWELELPDPPLFGREVLAHTINRRRKNVHDDIYNNFNTQASTQWDGLTHYGHQEYGFYNGVQEAQITGDVETRNGIEHWARRGIAGRGVLIDYARFAQQHDLPFSVGQRSEFSAAQLEAAAQWQGVTFQVGDILLIRTGWISWYESLSQAQRSKLAEPGAFACGGLAQSEESLQFLWDHHFAAVASDCPTVEAYPPMSPAGMMHEIIIGLWGMPIGEMFVLDALAAACARDGSYDFFLTSAPLNKRGGIASPPNALAIK